MTTQHEFKPCTKQGTNLHNPNSHCDVCGDFSTAPIHQVNAAKGTVATTTAIPKDSSMAAFQRGMEIAAEVSRSHRHADNQSTDSFCSRFGCRIGIAEEITSVAAQLSRSSEVSKGKMENKTSSRSEVVIPQANLLSAEPDAGSAWLLERAGKHGPEWITASGGLLNWTPDPNLALRLCRRADADQLAEIVEDCERVTEHEWVGSTDALVDEVQRRMDAVVDAAVDWAKAEDDEFDYCEILTERVDSLLQMRSCPSIQDGGSASGIAQNVTDESSVPHLPEGAVMPNYDPLGTSPVSADKETK